jgi:hypothetical protein
VPVEHDQYAALSRAEPGAALDDFETATRAAPYMQEMTDTAYAELAVGSVSR